MSGSGYCNYSAITTDGKTETRTAPLSSKHCAPFVSIVQPSTETSLVPSTEPTPETFRLDVVQQALSYLMMPSKVSCPGSLSDVAYPSCAAPAGIENNTCLVDLLNYIQSKANRIFLCYVQHQSKASCCNTFALKRDSVQALLQPGGRRPAVATMCATE